MTIDIIAIVSPKAGKADRVRSTTRSTTHAQSLTSTAQVEELLKQAAQSVKANEPGTLRYHLQRETKGDAPVFVVLET